VEVRHHHDVLGELVPGTRLGRWVIERKIGQGAMGAVYASHDERGGPAALKVLLGIDEAWVLRFEREARAARSVKHANVASTYPLERDGPFFILPMELVHGGNLRELVTKGGPLPWREAARLGLGIARGLSAIHGAGLVHRDLKPANVLLDPAREPKITDFGLVRRPGSTSVELTGTGELLGTFEYMAPEMGERADVDARADLYSLGATLYELLAGRPPFEGTGITVLAKHIREKPASLAPRGVPPELDALVLALLAKKPGERPGCDAVERTLEGLLLGTRPAPPKRRLWPAAMVAGVVVACGVGLAVHRTASADPPAPPEPPVTPTSKLDPGQLHGRYASVTTATWAALDLVRGHDEMRHVDAIRSIAFCRGPGNELYLLSGGVDGTVRAWDTRTGAQVLSFTVPSPVWTLDVSDVGPRVVVGTSLGFAGTYEPWSTRKGTPLQTKVYGPSRVAVAITRDGKTVASQADGQGIVQWDARSGDPTGGVIAEEPLGNCWFLRYTDDELVAGLDDGGAIRFGLKGSGLSPRHHHDNRHGYRWTSQGVVLRDGTFVTVGFDRRLAIERRGAETPIFREIHASAADVQGIAAFPRDLVATAGHDGRVELWELQGDPRRVGEDFHAHAAPVESVAVDPEGKLLATGSNDGTVRLFDIADRKLSERTFKERPSTHRAAIRAIALSGDVVLSASDDGTLKQWNAGTGALVATLGHHASPVVGAAFLRHAGGPFVLSLGRFDGLKLWRLGEPGELGTVPSGSGRLGAQHLAVSDDGRRAIVSLDWEDLAHVFDVDLDAKRLDDRGTFHDADITRDLTAHAAAFVPGSEAFVLAGAGHGRINERIVGNIFLGSARDVTHLLGEREECLDSVAFVDGDPGPSSPGAATATSLSGISTAAPRAGRRTARGARTCSSAPWGPGESSSSRARRSTCSPRGTGASSRRSTSARSTTARGARPTTPRGAGSGSAPRRGRSSGSR
jgi:WD40 repeat protein